MTRTHITLLLVAALAVGCGDDTPTAPTTTAVTTVSEQFTGTIPVRETRFYSYEVASAGTVSITLTSLSVPGSREVAPARVQLGVGIPKGEGCAVSQSVTASPGLAAQLTPSQSPGTYCASITDTGELQRSLDFTIRIVHP